MFKKKELENKIVYVLNGYAPSKLRYFNQRNNKKIKTVLMESHGDPSNAKNIDYLYDNNILCDKNIKVLITSEAQLEYIASKETLLNWFKEYHNQFLVTKFVINNKTYYEEPTLLSNKVFINKLLNKNKYNNNSVVSHAKIMTGSQYNKLSKKKKTELVVKTIYGSGSDGARINVDKVNTKDTYLVEKIIKSDKNIKFFVCTTLVTYDDYRGRELSVLTTSEDHSNFVNTGYPHTHADFSCYWQLKDFMNYLCEVFGVWNGLFETEVAYDSKKNKFYLIDLNPRWSTDHDCIKEKFGEIVGKNFDMLEHVYEEKSFCDKVERFLKKNPNYIGPMKYYASIFVDMKTHCKE